MIELDDGILTIDGTPYILAPQGLTALSWSLIPLPLIRSGPFCVDAGDVYTAGAEAGESNC